MFQTGATFFHAMVFVYTLTTPSKVRWRKYIKSFRQLVKPACVVKKNIILNFDVYFVFFRRRKVWTSQLVTPMSLLCMCQTFC